ncbi:hypothetical protein N8I84_40975 [Streptomyces cynarae]|uniref:Uncharacterized protein n=1 Tax=Streptomyces cynarae TaxID=2981134 RepID=A0ABY6EJ95_9ACTN|nr:hypothetical protein [Streptomyces cynarae]UXY24328.1 hypothetical protein N8I84_40975 [Streptomyces cynarae]
MSVYEVIKQLPAIATVRDRARALAVLDAVLSPECEWRYYSFDSGWSPGEEMASMRDGAGNDYAIVFSAAGVYAQACDHESPMFLYHVAPPALWPGLFDSVPDVFRPYLDEPAFADHNGLPRATVCFWRESADSQWRCGEVHVPDEDMDDADGAEWLFDVLIAGSAEAYREFAEEVYEVTLDLAAVQAVFDLTPLTQEIVSALNPEVTLGDLAKDIAQIGYPTTK